VLRRIAYIGVAGSVAIFGLAVAWHRAQVVSRSEITVGNVIDTAIAGGHSSQRRCYLKVDYVDSRGIHYTHWSETAFTLSEYGFGSQIPVHYNKDNPAFCYVGE
jgi:hypothetical protein